MVNDVNGYLYEQHIYTSQRYIRFRAQLNKYKAIKWTGDKLCNASNGTNVVPVSRKQTFKSLNILERVTDKYVRKKVMNFTHTCML